MHIEYKCVACSPAYRGIVCKVRPSGRFVRANSKPSALCAVSYWFSPCSHICTTAFWQTHRCHCFFGSLLCFAIFRQQASSVSCVPRGTGCLSICVCGGSTLPWHAQSPCAPHPQMLHHFKIPRGPRYTALTCPTVLHLPAVGVAPFRPPHGSSQALHRARPRMACWAGSSRGARAVLPAASGIACRGARTPRARAELFCCIDASAGSRGSSTGRWRSSMPCS